MLRYAKGGQTNRGAAKAVPLSLYCDVRGYLPLTDTNGVFLKDAVAAAAAAEQQKKDDPAAGIISAAAVAVAQERAVSATSAGKQKDDPNQVASSVIRVRAATVGSS